MVTNKCEELNKQAIAFVNNDLVAGIRATLEQLPHKALCLSDNGVPHKNVPVGAYYYDGDGSIVEQRVMCVKVLGDGSVVAYEDYPGIDFRFADVMDEDKLDDNNWFNLDTTNSGDYIALWTILDLVERIGDYLVPENYLYPDELEKMKKEADV